MAASVHPDSEYRAQASWITSRPANEELRRPALAGLGLAAAMFLRLRRSAS